MAEAGAMMSEEKKRWVITDKMLAEALRRLLPVAEVGVRCRRTEQLRHDFQAAYVLLGGWVYQNKDRELDGPMMEYPEFPQGYFRAEPK